VLLEQREGNTRLCKCSKKTVWLLEQAHTVFLHVFVAKVVIHMQRELPVTTEGDSLCSPLPT